MFSKFLLIILMFASIPSFAGQDGNGGFGIQCGRQFHLLDLYEAKNRYHYYVDLGAANLSVAEKVEIMLTRLEKFVPKVAAYYRQEALKLMQTIENRTAFLTGKKFVTNGNVVLETVSSIPLDIGLSLVCANAKFYPIARNHYFTKNDLQIFIYEKQWNRLNNDNKAALIIHELFYAKQQFTIKSRDSSLLRHLIALLSSREVEQLNLEQFLNKISFFIDRITQGGVDIYIYRGEKATFHANGLIKSVYGKIESRYVNKDSINMTFLENGDIDEIIFPNGGGTANLANNEILNNLRKIKYLYKDGKHLGFSVEGEAFFTPFYNEVEEGDFFNARLTGYPFTGIYHQVDLNGRGRCIELHFDSSPFNKNKDLDYFKIKILGESKARVFKRGEEVRVKLNDMSRPIAIGCDPLKLN